MDIESFAKLPINIVRNAGGIFKATQDILLGKVDRSPLTSRLLQQYQYGKPLLKPQEFSALVAAYKEWVYICSSKNATTAASIPLRLFVAKTSSKSKLLRPSIPITKDVRDRLHSKAGLQHIVRKSVEIEEIVEHNWLLLMKNVNPFMNRFMLWELTHLHLELTGNAYWWVIKNSAGVPAEIWPVQSQSMWIVPSKDKFIDGYLFKNGMNSISFGFEEIIHFKYANPNHSYYGFGPLSAITDSYNIYQNMNEYEKAIFRNMGRPDGLLETDQTGMDDETYERIHQEWEENYGGMSNAGKIAILESGTKYKPLNFAPKEMNFMKGREATKDVIRNAYGQTQAMFEASSLASAEIADRAYRKDTIEPRLTRIEEKINEQFMPLYNDMTLFVSFDDPVAQNKEEIRNEQKHRLEMGLSDINTERHLMGDEPYPYEEANVPFVATGRAAINAPKLAAPAQLSAMSELAENIAAKMLEG